MQKFLGHLNDKIFIFSQQYQTSNEETALMPKENLVIVESPAKAKTIQKFLGSDYVVMSSFGHIRDLKESDFGIDIEHNYKPLYVVSPDKKKLVADLKKAVEKSDTVWLASDEDREGEAIAWHLADELNLDPKRMHRIAFHEITKTAIQEAIKAPRDIDMNLVDAQQARRVLDRIVGFELSPVLWRKVKPNLSAGRVQSVTVRLVVEREREIQHFKPEASFRVTATLTTDNGEILTAELKRRFATQSEAEAFLEKCKNATFSVQSIETSPLKRTPAAPFTTSTLQQEASRKFGFPVSLTMRVAQALYESGKITYMRTDSVNLSSLALNTIQQDVVENYGEKYHKRRRYVTKTKGAQEAHEAIRPTFVSEHDIKGTPQEQKLYSLIWKRTVASQMADAELEKTTVNIAVSGTDEIFAVTGEAIKFDGFLKVYMESTDDEAVNNEPNINLPQLKVEQPLEMQQIVAQERFTQHPARYTEASLVRKLEELGIGRPSTYAPTISTIQNRGYVDKKEITGQTAPAHCITLKNGKIKAELKSAKTTIEKGKLSPTDIGIVVNDFLNDHFPNIMDYNFTAKVEEQFDAIAAGHEEWTESIDHFYKKFHPNVIKAMNLTGRKAGEHELGNDPKSGRPVIAKIGRYGAVVQIGRAEDAEKPCFASLKVGQSIETITLEEALELFKLPIQLGEFEGEPLSVGAGRFGPYVRLGKSTYVSIPKGEDPLTITAERAQELILKKRANDKNNELLRFDKADIVVIKGRFGPYIAHGGNNYKIPKTTDVEKLTLEACQKIIADVEAQGGPAKRRSLRRGTTKVTKTSAKKTTAKSKTKK